MRKGFTLVEIMIVVAIIGIILAIAIPGFIRAREVSRSRACQESLSKIDGAKEQWALENKIAETVTPTWTHLVGATKYLKSEPDCPAGGDYEINGVGANPTCDYDLPTWLSAEDDFNHKLKDL